MELRPRPRKTIWFEEPYEESNWDEECWGEESWPAAEAYWSDWPGADAWEDYEDLDYKTEPRRLRMTWLSSPWRSLRRPMPWLLRQTRLWPKPNRRWLASGSWQGQRKGLWWQGQGRFVICPLLFAKFEGIILRQWKGIWASQGQGKERKEGRQGLHDGLRLWHGLHP